MEGGRKKNKTYAVIGACLIVASLLFSVFRFQISAIRLWQSLKDFGLSVVYYTFSMADIYGGVQPTVTQIPSEMPQLLPIEWEEFKALFFEFWKALGSWSNFTVFLEWLVGKIVKATPWTYFILLIVMLIAVLFALKILMLGKPKRWVEDKQERPPTKPLRAWLWLEDRIFYPLARFIKDYWAWLKKKKRLIVVLILIWAYNFNASAILCELLAYIFYLGPAITDPVYKPNFYSQIVKLVLDLSVMINFLPWFIELYVGLKIVNKWRRKTGDKRLEKKDDKNGQLLEDNPGTIFIQAPPRFGKGLVGTDMVLKQEVKFRADARDDMRQCRIEFPYFPWDRLERFMRQAIDRHVLYTKEGTRDFIDGLQFMHRFSSEMDPWIVEGIRYRLKSFCGYEYDDFLFGYDWKKHGTSFNNGIVMVSLFESLVDYAQLYFVYDAPTSLIFSTQGVRVDFKRKTIGYRPKYDLNYLKRKPEEVDEISIYSHIKNADSERLGRRIAPENLLANGYEIAVAYEPEIDKERGNQITLAGVSANSEEVNQRNDLYGWEEKMHNHAAMIRYRPYYRKIIDAQRDGAVAADVTEMTMGFQIVESKKEKVVIPFFWIEKTLYEPLKKIYDKLDDELSYMGEPRTLFAHLVTRLYMPIARRYRQLSNAYGTQEKVMRIKNGQTGEIVNNKVVWTVINRRAKAKRYTTDGILNLYRKRVVYRSTGGLNDFETFKGIRNTDVELKKTNGLFYRDFPKYFNGEYEAERQRVKMEKALKEMEKEAKAKAKAEKEEEKKNKKAGKKERKPDDAEADKG